jgi:hypothetical protein
VDILPRDIFPSHLLYLISVGKKIFDDRRKDGEEIPKRNKSIDLYLPCILIIMVGNGRRTENVAFYSGRKWGVG